MGLSTKHSAEVRQAGTALQANAKSGFPTPKNKHGFVVYHTKTNRPIESTKLMNLLTRVIGPVHEKVVEQVKQEIEAEVK